jgi:hypothetical protein
MAIIIMQYNTPLHHQSQYFNYCLLTKTVTTITTLCVRVHASHGRALLLLLLQQVVDLPDGYRLCTSQNLYAQLTTFSQTTLVVQRT